MEARINTPIDIAAPLCAWYQNNARALPWRKGATPYHIWVSEIMLQQTRVEAVKAYYLRFIEALPDIAALATVEDDVLLKLWEGLGYYSRARNLKRAAEEVMRAHNGVLPREPHVLQTLPGIGPYTAGAIASIAFGLHAPAVDGNVLRVLARLYNDHTDIALPKTRRDAEAIVLKMMQSAPPSIFTQALMELGALLCLPNTPPKCPLCPLVSLCRGHAAGSAAALPVKSKKRPRRVEARTVFVLRRGDTFAVCRRPQHAGLLRGLWELPNIDGHVCQEAMAAQLTCWGLSPAGGIARYARRHVFTHIEWELQVYALHVECAALPAGWEWAQKDVHALPTAFRVCL